MTSDAVSITARLGFVQSHEILVRSDRRRAPQHGEARCHGHAEGSLASNLCAPSLPPFFLSTLMPDAWRDGFE